MKIKAELCVITKHYKSYDDKGRSYKHTARCTKCPIASALRSWAYQHGSSSRYASEPQAGKAEFVQITDGGTYVPAARLESTRGARSGSSAMQFTNRLSIEIRLAKFRQ